MWKNILDSDSIRRQYGACALHAGYLRLQTHTHSQYVILIDFPLQQWLRERTSMLRLHKHCLSCCSKHTKMDNVQKVWQLCRVFRTSNPSFYKLCSWCWPYCIL